jgi:hypothetical protein
MTIDTDGSVTQDATLGGTTTIDVANGTATFSDLTLDRIGINYTLKATAGALSLVSAAFTIL